MSIGIPGATRSITSREESDVALARLAQRAGRVHHRGRFAVGRLALAATQPFGDHRDIGELGGAFDLRVAGEDLLDQGRARARQANDKYGVARRTADLVASFEKFF